MDKDVNLFKSPHNLDPWNNNHKVPYNCVSNDSLSPWVCGLFLVSGATHKVVLLSFIVVWNGWFK